MLPLNHCSSPFLESCSLTGRPIPNQMPVKISVHVVFGVQGKMHFLILGFFILTHQAIAPQQQPQHIESMKLPKRENMPNGFVKLNTDVFTPLVFSTTGGMGREAATFYKRLADKIARKEGKNVPTVMGWLRCRLSFAILRSAILCIRGSRSSRHRPTRDIALATSEGHVLFYLFIFSCLLTILC